MSGDLKGGQQLSDDAYVQKLLEQQQQELSALGPFLEPHLKVAEAADESRSQTLLLKSGGQQQQRDTNAELLALRRELDDVRAVRVAGGGAQQPPSRPQSQQLPTSQAQPQPRPMMMITPAAPPPVCPSAAVSGGVGQGFGGSGPSPSAGAGLGESHGRALVRDRQRQPGG